MGATPTVVRRLLHLITTFAVLLASAFVCQSAGVELSSSAILFYNSDLQPVLDGNISQCELLLRRAVVHGGRRIQIVPTHYWYDAADASQDPDSCYPDNWEDTSLKVDYYCSKADWQSSCQPFNPAVIATFQSGMQDCLSLAVQLYDEVLVTPHLDAAAGSRISPKWRNMLRFDPIAKDQYGYSYWDTMLLPITEAANAAFAGTTGKRFQFAMQGEMGGTVLNYPASYLSIISNIKSKWQAPSDLQTGITFANGYIPGQLNHIPAPKTGPCQGRDMPLLPFNQWPGVQRLKAVLPDIQQLVQQVGFVGVSNYARAPPDVQSSNIENSTAKLVAEFQAMGIDFQSQLSTGKQFIWNEFGLGGGASACGDVPGSGPQIGNCPWLGITGSYKPETDPFKQYAAARAYLIKFYDTTLQVLESGGVQYPVNGAYIWNVGSWDVQGISTSSAEWNTSVVQGSWPYEHGYAVPEVVAAIRQHNEQVNT